MSRDELRARLLTGAGAVFHRDGIAATGMAALAAELHISKRTVYELFGSKDELVAAALAAGDEPTRAAFTDAAERAADDPRARLVALFAALEDRVAAPGFRGCPFLNATAELADRDHPAHAVCRGHKEGLRRWIEDTARRAGFDRPDLMYEQLLVLVDGALARAAVDPPPRGTVVAVARAVLEAAERAHAVRQDGPP